MKIFVETTKRIIFAATFALTLTACTPDDNISEIFVGRQWTLSYIQEGSVKRYNGAKKYDVLFTDATFSATTPSGSTISGKWEANGETRKFHCWNVQTTGTLKGDTIAEKMLRIFTDATSYDGDTNWLQIKKDKKTFMQFYNK